jgi:hypothetical protein
MRLLTAEELAPHASALSHDQCGNIRSDLLDDPVCGTPLRNYVVITLGSFDDQLSVVERLYNRYYWFQRLVAAHRTSRAYDAGLEQQAMQILERADCELDWEIVAQIDEMSMCD